MPQSSKLIAKFGAVEVGRGAVNNLKSGSTKAVGLYKAPAPVALTDASVTLTATQLLTGLLRGVPTATDKTLTLPTAALLVAALPGVEVGDCFEYTVVNDGVGDGIDFIVAIGSGVTNVGFMSVVDTSTAEDNAGSGSGRFRIRFTNVSSGTEACTNTRIA
jgi:hypothetical protein